MENFELYIRRGFLVIYKNSEFITSVDINHIVSVGVNCFNDVVLSLTGEGGKPLYGLLIGEVNTNNEKLGNKLAHSITQGIVNYIKIVNHIVAVNHHWKFCELHLKNIDTIKVTDGKLEIIENTQNHIFNFSGYKSAKELCDKLRVVIKEYREYLDNYDLFKHVILDTEISIEEK